MNRQSEFPVRNAVLISIYLVCIYSYSTLYVQYSRLQFGRCWLVQHLGENVLVLVTVRSVMFAHTLENTKRLRGDIQRCTNQIHPIIFSIEGLTSGGRTYPSTRLRYICSQEGDFLFF